jgi:parvulin-like peptidyl-prolyl isomerase
MIKMTKPGTISRADLILLTIGAIAVLVALYVIKFGHSSDTRLASNVVASVEGRLIPLDRYEALLADMAADSKDPLDASDRQFALDRLVDEELLVIRAVELRLDRSDPMVRKAMAATLIESIVNQAESLKPDEMTLRQFHEENRGFFTASASQLIHWYRGPIPVDTNHTMQSLSEAVKIGDVEHALHTFGLERVEILPEQPLNLSKTREYLGPTLAGAVQTLEPGQWSAPLIVDAQLHILYLAAQGPGWEPSFEDIRDQVLAEFRRRQGEQALRRYLANLRKDRDIRVNSDALVPQ